MRESFSLIGDKALLTGLVLVLFGPILAHQQGVPDSRRAAAATVEAAATMRARELAQVFTGDPEGIYQAQTLRQVLAQAIAYLNECGLHGAAVELERRTR